MFDIGWGELLVIGIVALIAIGSKNLPGVLLTTGGEIRRMVSDFQDQFREAMREAEMDELKKQVDQMSRFHDRFREPMREINLVPGGFWQWVVIAILVLLLVAAACVKFIWAL